MQHCSPRDYFGSVLKKVRSTWPAFWQLKLPTDDSVFTISHSPFLTYGLCVCVWRCRCVGVGVCACVGMCESATESVNVSVSQCVSKWWHCSDVKHQRVCFTRQIKGIIFTHWISMLDCWTRCMWCAVPSFELSDLLCCWSRHIIQQVGRCFIWVLEASKPVANILGSPYHSHLQPMRTTCIKTLCRSLLRPYTVKVEIEKELLFIQRKRSCRAASRRD